MTDGDCWKDQRTRHGHMSWKNYWRDHSSDYIRGLGGPYHRNRMDMIQALLEGVTFSGKMCVDFGCGDGLFCEYLLANGASVLAIDADSTMAIAAEKRLRQRWPGVDVRTGGVGTLATLPAQSVDYLVAFNVLAYLTRDEEAMFYDAARRIIRPGGACCDAFE